jgi:hypothetical protein
VAASLAETQDSFPTRSSVDIANAKRLSEIPGPGSEYIATDIAGVNVDGEFHSPTWVEAQLDEQTLWPRVLRLKIGATVMLVMVCVAVRKS